MYSKKVLYDGKKVNLIDAFDIYKHSDSSFDLVLKDGVTMLDGTELTQETLDKWFKKENAEHQLHAGFFIDTVNFMRDFLKTIHDGEFAVKWSNIPTRQKYNVRRQLSEWTTIGITCALGNFVALVMKKRPEREQDFWWRLMLYTIKGTERDLYQFTPVGLPDLVLQRLKNPIPAAKTLEGIFYIIMGLLTSDIITPSEEAKKKVKEKEGESYNEKEYWANHKPTFTETKYWHNVRKKNLPPWWQIQQLKKFATDNLQFNSVGGFPEIDDSEYYGTR